MPFLRTVYEYTHFINDFLQTKKYPSELQLELENSSLSNKVYLITGASSGIGFQVAKYLGSKQAKVYISGRTDSKLKQAVEELRNLGYNVEGILMDYLDLTTIPHALEKLVKNEEFLNGVVHNAGALFSNREYQTSVQGLEKHLAVNSVGPHLVQRLISSLLVEGGRVVWVTCAAHVYADYDFKIDMKLNQDTDKYERYGYSKLFPLFESNLDNNNNNIVSVACNPGTVSGTDILRQQSTVETWLENAPFFAPSVENGAYNELFALLDLSVQSGDYITPFGEKNNKPREDVLEWMNGQEAKEAYQWMEKVISPYTHHI